MNHQYLLLLLSILRLCSFTSVVAVELFAPTNITAPFLGDDNNTAIIPKNDRSIRTAIDLWMSRRQHAESIFGHISDWDTSNVTDMSFLFCNLTNFNENLSRWNTSAVVTMEEMFRGTRSFRGNISLWDTSSVRNMKRMFYEATSFNWNISSWHTSRVRNFDGMFEGASTFNHDLSNWDTTQSTTMQRMFMDATSFHQTLCWDIRGKEVFQMLCNTHQGTNVSQLCTISPCTILHTTCDGHYDHPDCGTPAVNLSHWQRGIVFMVIVVVTLSVATMAYTKLCKIPEVIVSREHDDDDDDKDTTDSILNIHFDVSKKTDGEEHSDIDLSEIEP